MYNLEVEGDHCYRVGEQGLLVHNASVAIQQVTTGGADGLAYAQRTRAFRNRRPNPSWGENFGYLIFLSKEDQTIYLGRDGATNPGGFGRLTPERGYNTPGVGDTNDPAIAEQHTEQRLLRDLEARAQRNQENVACDYGILSLFTEREPCRHCTSFLPMAFVPLNQNKGPKEVPIYFVAMSVGGYPATADQLRMAYQALNL